MAKPKPKKTSAAKPKRELKKRGPPAWEPTAEERRKVEHYCAIGFTQEQVALVMGKSVDSLDRYCRHELDAGALKVNGKVGAQLYDKCMKGDTTALIFWAKTRMGFRETSRHEHAFDLTGLSDEELEQLERLRSRIAQP